MTGYTMEEIETERAGDALRLHPLSQDEYMRLVTSRISVGEAEILPKNGYPLVVEYVVIPTSSSGNPLYLGMMWPLAFERPRTLTNQLS